LLGVSARRDGVTVSMTLAFVGALQVDRRDAEVGEAELRKRAERVYISRLRMAIGDPYHLDRFVTAQDADGTYGRALVELRAGRKTGHWMWFVFPQIAGLGQSETSRRYAIASRAEAAAFLQHALLGPRLIECAHILAVSRALSATEIFGPVDARKLRSCMTLFMRAAPGESLFGSVLERYFAGVPDRNTDRLLRSQGDA
jgi:uncharacterized protein (DUF1810 family)